MLCEALRYDGPETVTRTDWNVPRRAGVHFFVNWREGTRPDLLPMAVA
jgi:hypothetical protein